MRWWVAFAFLCAGLVSRLPFLTNHLWAHDSVLYERAIASFSPEAHQPQPPGYLWYVLLLRGVAVFTADANRAMTLVSLVAGAAAVVLLYVLAARLFEERIGRVAALLLLTAVTFWGESVVAYPYTLLAALSVGCALLFWLSATAPAAERGRRLVLASAVWGIATGFRLDLVLFLAPLWLFAATATSRRAVLASALAAIAPGAAWLAASAAASGGLDRFLTAFAAQSRFVNEQYSVVGNGPVAVVRNGSDLARFLGRGLMFLLIPLAALLLPGARRALLADRRAATFVLLWTFVPLPLLLAVHVGEYGYVFSMLPGLCVLAALGIAWFAERVPARRAFVLGAAAVAGANALLFLVSPMPLSAGDLARRDYGVSERVQALDALPERCALVVTGYDHLIVERYMRRHPVLGYHPWQRPPDTQPRRLDFASCQGEPTVVLWDDLLRTGDGRWRTERMAHGALLRLGNASQATALVTDGLTVHIR